MTSTENHHKHPPLIKPLMGEWGRNEIAFLGAPCDMIRKLTDTISITIGTHWKTCYVDADHAMEDETTETHFHGAAILTDKIQALRLDFKGRQSVFERRAALAPYDVILVNGNHFTAAAQIILLDTRKLASLERKLDRLTNVIAVLEVDTTIEQCDFLRPVLTAETSVFHHASSNTLVEWLIGRFLPAPVSGLVLAGGKSMRMGKDKTVMHYHGRPQREYARGLFEALGIEVYTSCRADQLYEFPEDHLLVLDRFIGMGPFGAILSAFQSNPNHAWLVLASDLPFVTTQTLEALIAGRDASRIATAFYNPGTDFPEPLITLWEPKAYPVLLSFLAQGIACPRKVLINSEIKLISADDPRWLRNVNTPDDAEEVRSLLQSV